MKQEKLKSVFSEYYTNDESIELVIQMLKDAGASQMECTRTLLFELKMSLPEADKIVVHSAAWSDRKEGIEKFRDGMFDAGNEMDS